MDIKDSFETIFSDVKRVLVVMAHPDDCETVCGGTVARLISTGVKVRLVATTNGGKGFKDKLNINEHDFGETRKQELINAGIELGIDKDDIFDLDVPDGELEHDYKNIGSIALHIRQFKPDLIITHNPIDKIIIFNEKSLWVNHRDHQNTGLIALDAAYPYSRDRGFYPEHFSKYNVTPHKVTKILFSDNYTYPLRVNFDITDFVSIKRNALNKHISALDSNEVEECVSEGKVADKYFESFRFVNIW